MPTITPQEILDLVFYALVESGLSPYLQVGLALMFMLFTVRRIFGDD